MKESDYSRGKIRDIAGLEISLEKLVILGIGNNKFWFQVGQQVMGGDTLSVVPSTDVTYWSGLKRRRWVERKDENMSQKKLFTLPAIFFASPSTTANISLLCFPSF